MNSTSAVAVSSHAVFPESIITRSPFASAGAIWLCTQFRLCPERSMSRALDQRSFSKERQLTRRNAVLGGVAGRIQGSIMLYWHHEQGLHQRAGDRRRLRRSAGSSGLAAQSRHVQG